MGGEKDVQLTDLWRYNAKFDEWTEMVPGSSFDTALVGGSAMGSNFMLTTWGLIRFGGYVQSPSYSPDGNNYLNGVYIQDPLTLRWQEVVISGKPELSGNVLSDGISPSARYLSASVFLPTKLYDIKHSFGYRSLYDEKIQSNQVNFEGLVADSFVVFGGQNGATGSIVDGSSGGYLNDMWALRLSNWSLPDNIYKQQKHMQKNCKWRLRAANTQRPDSCITSQECEFYDLLMLAWCDKVFE